MTDIADSGRREDADDVQAEGQAKPIATRHDLRLTLEKLRYTVEFFMPLFEKKPAMAFLKHLKTLQDDLGHLNEVAVAEVLIAGYLARSGKRGIAAAAGMVIGWHVHSVAVFEPRLVANWQAFTRQHAFWS